MIALDIRHLHLSAALTDDNGNRITFMYLIARVGNLPDNASLLNLLGILSGYNLKHKAVTLKQLPGFLLCHPRQIRHLHYESGAYRDIDRITFFNLLTAVRQLRDHIAGRHLLIIFLVYDVHFKLRFLYRAQGLITGHTLNIRNRRVQGFIVKAPSDQNRGYARSQKRYQYLNAPSPSRTGRKLPHLVGSGRRQFIEHTL